jgi:UDP-galactopyranose mutase
LLEHTDLVFTGGFSLFEAKRHHHANAHPFPSGVDVEHFRPARGHLSEPIDQRTIPHPRLGFYGVIDERLDMKLLADVAALRPEWQIVLVGPVVKVDPASLPRSQNLHYLGGKQYAELPSYLAHWDVAIMPFALNQATRFISPTKTPEYLAGGKPVVSTPISDVVRQYGQTDSVLIAQTAPDFVAAVEHALHLGREPARWLPAVDDMLARASWKDIWTRMSGLIDEKCRESEVEPVSLSRVAQWA